MNVDEDWGDVFLHVKRGSKDDRGKKEEDITTITLVPRVRNKIVKM